MGLTLTPEQKTVRDIRNSNLLVSAAAGSGKTAVLVERIKSLINDEKNPVGIDSFLIVTFTRAAASEMKERIYKSLSGRQRSLVPYANITTIDGFCSKILREHFNEAGISPNFSVSSESELKILESKILDEIIEEKLKSSDQNFINLCKFFTKREKLTPLKQAVFDIYKAQESTPWPKKWLLEIKKDYELVSLDELENSLWYKDLTEYIRSGIRDIVFEEEELSRKYTEEYMADVNALNALLSLNDSDLLMAIPSFSFPTLRIKNIDGIEKEKAKKERDSLKKLFSEMASLVITDKEDFIRNISDTCPIVTSLIDLVLQFGEILLVEKHKKSSYSFSDVAHLALSVLRDENTGEITETAKNIRDSYSHIMVDEYQDSNFLQEAILSSVTKDGEDSNYFMVGDVKQSIYRFRQARPELFTEKYEAYKAGKANSKTVDLSRNFRSRNAVTKVVNSVFKKIMTKEIGGIEYDSSQELVFSAEYYDKDLPGNDAKLYLTASDDEYYVKEHIDKDTAEAMMIGKIIKDKVVGKILVTDGNLKRPAEYKDIVILHRAANEVSTKYTEALKSMEIPLLSTGKKGYFDTFEVNSLVSYLNLLNNPYNDIALASVLINFYGFSENDLLKIRKTGFNRNFSDDFYELKDEFLEELGDALGTRYRNFIESFYEIKLSSKKKRIYETIQDIIVKTGFNNKVLSLPGGKDRISNIEKLVDLAVKFDNFGNGLFDFVKTLSDIKEFDINIPISVSAPKDSVTLMTIHKSKGLEFPICILAGSLRQIKPSDSGPEGMVISEKYGLGLDFLNINNNTKRNNPKRETIKLFEARENRAEVIRILYVAMTRAKEKLIITGCGKASIIEKLLEEKSRNISCTKRLKVQTPLELMLPGLIDSDVEINVIKGEDIIKEDDEENANKDIVPNVVNNEELIKTEYKEYPVLQGKLMSKYSVSELKKAEHSSDDENEVGELIVKEREFTPYVPKFIKKSEDNNDITGAERGTAYHKIMEIAEFKEDIDIINLLEKSVENGYLNDIEKNAIDSEKIREFFDSNLGKRMCKAESLGNLFKERFFVMSLPTHELFTKLSFSREEMADSTLVQGVIDAFFIEENEIVVMDYKTDGLGKYTESEFPKVLTDRYKKQLELYSLALNKALGLNIKEVFIYSFALGREIQLEM